MQVLMLTKPSEKHVETCTYTTFGEITQSFIKDTSAKNNTSVLALIMSYETREDNFNKAFRVSSWVIYTIIQIMTALII